MKIVKGNEIIHQQLKSSQTGEEYSQSAVLSEKLGTKDLFISHEVIRPRSRSSGAHYHMVVDEIIYVLQGQVTAVEGDDQIELFAGDSLSFSANSKKKHFLLNESNEEAQVLVIRKMTVSEDVIF